MGKSTTMGVEVSPRDQVNQVSPALGVIQQAGISCLEWRSGGLGHPMAGMIAMANESTIVTTISQMNTFIHVF